MAIYVTVTLVTMLLIAMAIFMVTVAKNKEQMQVSLKIKEAYEADNARAAEIYASLTGTLKMYNFMAYDRVLSASEIQETFNINVEMYGITT